VDTNNKYEARNDEEAAIRNTNDGGAEYNSFHDDYPNYLNV